MAEPIRSLASEKFRQTTDRGRGVLANLEWYGVLLPPVIADCKEAPLRCTPYCAWVVQSRVPNEPGATDGVFRIVRAETPTHRAFPSCPQSYCYYGLSPAGGHRIPARVRYKPQAAPGSARAVTHTRHGEPPQHHPRSSESRQPADSRPYPTAGRDAAAVLRHRSRPGRRGRTNMAAALCLRGSAFRARPISLPTGELGCGAAVAALGERLRRAGVCEGWVLALRCPIRRPVRSSHPELLGSQRLVPQLARQGSDAPSAERSRPLAHQGQRLHADTS